MAATVVITLQVRISTQKHDKVAVTGACDVLGQWNPEKIVFLKKKQSPLESELWYVKINVPLSCEGLEYRYLVCRKYISAHGDEPEEETHIIRHWEAGVFSRYKTLSELGSEESIDCYGEFPPERCMFVDQGWLMSDTEIQLRFHNNPIHIFKKRDQTSKYNIKCCTVNLYTDEVVDDVECVDQFYQSVHASNPPIRVSSLGEYDNQDQSAHGMPVSDADYVIFKLKTFEFNSHGIKVQIYKPTENSSEPSLYGYTNILPLHLENCTGSLVLVLNSLHGFPIGHITVRYLVCKPNKYVKYSLAKSFSKWWNRDRPTLEIGHRGLGDTHSTDINYKKEQNVKHENTLGSLMTAGEMGADYVEFDVMLSKDKVPIIWHDFKVSILLRKRSRGKHQVYNIPVHELTLAQLQDLRVEYVKHNSGSEHYDVSDVTEEHNLHDKLSPFPLLRDALREIDPNLGFYVEIKYPIYLYDNKSKEEGIESFFERNSFLDPILKVLHEEGGSRRIVIASFDPDTCIMARLKQNRYPVFFLVEDLGGGQPYFSDTRTHSVTSAVALAKSEKFLGVSINAAALMRKEDKLLEYVFAQQMICFVWGPDANNVEVRQDLKDRHVHAICHDEIGKNHRTSIYRAEHEDRIQKLATLYQSISPGLSPSHSLKGSAASLSTLESLEDSRSQLSLKAEKSNSSSYLLPTVTVTRDSATQSSSFHSTMQTDVTLNGQNATIQDYRTDFY